MERERLRRNDRLERRIGIREWLVIQHAFLGVRVSSRVGFDYGQGGLPETMASMAAADYRECLMIRVGKL